MRHVQKKFVVWYESGAGGFFISWLLNIALNPTIVDSGLAVFPTELEKNANGWKNFEQTAPDVGILCNMFVPESESNYKHLSKENLFHELMTLLQTKGQQTNDLLPLRSKFFLVNYILKSSNTTFEKRHNINFKSIADQYSLDDFKHITDVLFDNKKNIFLISPKEYTRMACFYKRVMHVEIDLESMLLGYNNVKIFKLESIWKNYWQTEIENILSRPLTQEQYNACDTFIKRYMQVMPKELLEFCHAG